MLKGLVSRFALDNKEFLGYKFEWSPYPAPRSEFLKLNNVAVTFTDGGVKNGVLLNCRVHFARRPLKPGGETWASENSALDPIAWSLEPVMQGDSVAWWIPELRKTLSSADLAEKIAIELSRYHAAYEEAYGRTGAAPDYR